MGSWEAARIGAVLGMLLGVERLENGSGGSGGVAVVDRSVRAGERHQDVNDRQ